MQSADLEKLIQAITNRVVAQLEKATKSEILFQGKIEAYPATYVQKLSADYHFMFGTKQDSDAILLCLSQMTLPQLLAVVKLTPIDEETTQVVEFLLAGKPVWIFDQAPRLVTYRQQTRYGVWRQLQDALQRLDAMDIHFITDTQVFDHQLETLNRRQTHAAPKRHYVSRLALEKRWENHQTELAANEVLTDEAAEWAAKHRQV